jgi:ribosomal subunit interface protein
MRIDIKGTQLELTPSLKTFITQKIGSVGKLLSRLEREGELTLFFEIARTTKHHRHGDVFYAEATLAFPGGQTIRIEEKDADARVAIDRVRDRLKLEVKRRKDRKSERIVRSRKNARQ